MKTTSLSIILLLFVSSLALHAQDLDTGLFTIPSQYTVLKTTEKISIDGHDNENSWAKAPWTAAFTDIATGKPGSNPALTTRAKLLWDDNYLYIYIKLTETDVWATLKEHDSSVFQENAVEIFMEPDGDMQNYIEFQINALATVWDLLLTKPYRNGGTPISDWDIKGLEKAVYIDGTINNPSDRDRYWSVELAFPFRSLLMSRRATPKVNDIWRLNVSRVQREVEIDKDKGTYSRKLGENNRPLAPEYLAWSTPGIVNFHYPERYGYIKLGDTTPTTSPFLNTDEEEIKLAMWHCYYLQKEFKEEHGTYAPDLSTLKKEYKEVSSFDSSNITVQGLEHQFWIQYSTSSSSAFMAIDQDGRVYR